jgi:hypothetical protein
MMADPVVSSSAVLLGGCAHTREWRAALRAIEDGVRRLERGGDYRQELGTEAGNEKERSGFGGAV